MEDKIEIDSTIIFFTEIEWDFTMACNASNFLEIS